jgi:uncharacterized integral membrane protein
LSDFQCANTNHKNKKSFFLVFVFISLIALAHSFLYINFTIDDAFITFSFSKNFASGRGFVVTPGNNVEATSSFLWAVLLIPFEFFGLGAVAGSKVLGVFFMIASLSLSIRLFQELSSERGWQWTLLAVLPTSFSTSFVLWCVYGMENALVAFLFLATLFLLYRETKNGLGMTSLFAILGLIMVRPEGFLYVPIFLATRFASKITLRRNFIWLAALLMLWTIYEVFGWLYFESLLPNTVGAKVYGSIAKRAGKGLVYLFGYSGIEILGFTINYTFFLFCLGAFIFFIASKMQKATIYEFLAAFRSNIGISLCVAVLVTHVCFVILVGGDWMPRQRFLSHIIPILFIIFAFFARHVTQVARNYVSDSLLVPGIVGLILFFVIGFIMYNIVDAARLYKTIKSFHESEERALFGVVDFANALASPDDYLACSDIGRPAYRFKGRILDWWGLADREIVATNQAGGNLNPDADIVLKRKPRFLVVYSNGPELSIENMARGAAKSTKSFYASQKFHDNYRQIYVVEFSPERHHLLFILEEKN